MGRSSRNWSVLVAIVVLVGWARADVDQDKAECMDQLIGLATCLPYVSNEAKAPTVECCSGVKQVVQKSMKCLCILIKDKDDPSLGLNINTTVALGLPGSCHSPTNLTKCIDLLHLPLNSTEAKLYKDFENSIEGKNSTVPGPHGKGNSSGSTSSSSSSSSSASNAGTSSDGVQRKIRWFEMVLIGVSALLFTLPHHISGTFY